MSLLEDIFLQDEANEAQELERVIEGDEYDDRPRSAASNSDENSAKEDEAEEDKRRVDPTSTKTKRVVKNPRFILNPARLTGPRGMEVIPEHFKDFRFKGKGHEKEDLDLVLKKLEHWAYRLYPKFGFEDCIKKIETLGKKRPVMVHLQKIRSDQLQSAETVVQKDSSDDEDNAPPEEDEFDKLLQQQIELARATPAPESARKATAMPRHAMSPFTMPKATSSPSISDEQKERMLRNRKLAEERRLARLKQNTNNPEAQSVKLNTLHERLSNEYEQSHSDEEHNVIPVTVEINNTNKTITASKGEEVFDELIEHRGANEMNNEIDTAVDISEHTDNTLNNDEMTHDNGVEKASNNTENVRIDKINTDISENSENIETNINTKQNDVVENDNTVQQEIMKVSNDITDTPNTDHNKEIEKLPREETSKTPQITTEVTLRVENACDTESINANDEQESIEFVTTDKEINRLSNEDTEKNEHAERTSVIENIIGDKSDLDKLAENELMDVDFDDDF